MMNQQPESPIESTPRTMPTTEQVSSALESARKLLPEIEPIEYLCSPSRHPALRSWLALESVPLKPYFTSSRANDTGRLVWQFHTTANKDRQINPPQILIVWLWPEMELVRVERLGSISVISKHLLSSKCLMKHSLLPVYTDLLINNKPSPTLQPELESAYTALAGKPLDFLSEPSASIYSQSKSENRPADPAPNPLINEVLPALKHTDLICEKISKVAADLRLITPRSIISGARKLCAKSLFSVAVCGEFSRGKTSLINSLLNNDTLPTGALPTTQFLIKVSYSESERMVWQQKQRPPLVLAASKDSWSKLAPHMDKETRGVMQVFSSNPWLKDGLEILDTPGSNESDTVNHESVSAAIQFADAAVVCVSATAPLSLTEQSLIQDHILFHQVPRVVVVLNFLDQIKSNERQEVVTFARKILDQIAPHARLGTNLERTTAGNLKDLDFAGQMELRELLSGWATDACNTSLIKNQVMSLLARAREQGIKELSERIEISKKSRESLEIETDEKRRLLHEKAMEWRDLQLEFSNRCESHSERFEQVLVNHGEEAIEKFHYELRSRSDPGTWLKEDLGFRLKQELKSAALQIERLIQQAFVGDSQWLAREIFTRYGTNLDAFEATTGLDLRQLADENSVSIGEFEDLKKLRKHSRVGTAAATVVGFFLVGPLVSLVSVGAGLTSDLFIGKRIEQQRELVMAKVNEIVKAAFRDACRIVRERCRYLYNKRVSSLADAASKWEAIRIETMKRQMDDKFATVNHSEDLIKWTDYTTELIKE